MNLDRRTFLKAGLGLAAAAGTPGLSFPADNPLAQAYFTDQAAKELECWIATSHGVRLAGRPRSLAAVRQGFWPIPPERVLILHPRPDDSVERGMPDILRASYLYFDLHAWPTGCSHSRQALDAAHRLSPQKVMLIGRITSALADHYGVPGLWEQWGYSMACREGLGSTYSVSNIAQPDRFQFGPLGNRRIRTDNHDIDHWLILIPDGTRDWDGWNQHCDVHVMVIHVVSDPEHSCPALPILCLSQQAIYSLIQAEPWCHWARDPSPRIIELSRMSRAAAARLFSERLIAAARELDDVSQRK